MMFVEAVFTDQQCQRDSRVPLLQRGGTPRGKPSTLHGPAMEWHPARSSHVVAKALTGSAYEFNTKINGHGKCVLIQVWTFFPPGVDDYFV